MQSGCYRSCVVTWLHCWHTPAAAIGPVWLGSSVHHCSCPWRKLSPGGPPLVMGHGLCLRRKLVYFEPPPKNQCCSITSDLQNVGVQPVSVCVCVLGGKPTTTEKAGCRGWDGGSGVPPCGTGHILEGGRLSCVLWERNLFSLPKSWSTLAIAPPACWSGRVLGGMPLV